MDPFFYHKEFRRKRCRSLADEVSAPPLTENFQDLSLHHYYLLECTLHLIILFSFLVHFPCVFVFYSIGRVRKEEPVGYREGCSRCQNGIVTSLNQFRARESVLPSLDRVYEFLRLQKSTWHHFNVVVMRDLEYTLLFIAPMFSVHLIRRCLKSELKSFCIHTNKKIWKSKWTNQTDFSMKRAAFVYYVIIGWLIQLFETPKRDKNCWFNSMTIHFYQYYITMSIDFIYLWSMIDI